MVGQPSPGENTPLGPCRLGFHPNEDRDRPCDWLAGGRCYDDKLAACACICPRDRTDSICSSGFFRGSGKRTPVSCL
jgi:hypothetical protein